MHFCSGDKGSCVSVYLTVQSLQLLLGSWSLALWGLVHGGHQQLGITEQSMGTLQVTPEALLHVKISVAHLGLVKYI